MNQLTIQERFDPASQRKYLMLFVDEQPLDTWLNRRCPEEELGVLIPTLLTWLKDPEERQVVWGRLYALGSDSVAVPLLMSIDDVDLWFTVIVVEMQQTATHILWSRIGIEWGEHIDMPYSIGKNVYWLEEVEQLEFDLQQHQQVVHTFNQLIQQEEVEGLSDDAAQRSSRFS